jgi:hypothetical protein
MLTITVLTLLRAPLEAAATLIPSYTALCAADMSQTISVTVFGGRSVSTCDFSLRSTNGNT